MGWNPFKSIAKGFEKAGNWVKDRVEDAVDFGKGVAKGAVGLLTGAGGSQDPEAARQAEEERKFNQEMEAQTAQLQAENNQIAGMLRDMRSDSGDMFKAAMDGAPGSSGNATNAGMFGNMLSESEDLFNDLMGGAPGPGPLSALPQNFEGNAYFEGHSNPQAFGAPQSFSPASGPPPDFARALQQYGLDLYKLRMT